MKMVQNNIKNINRFLLFLMVLLASYEVIIGGNSEHKFAAWAYTIGFGVLIVSGLMMIILGNEGLDSSAIVIISTIIPLAISLGLIDNFIPAFSVYYLIFSIIGLVLIIITRSISRKLSGTIILMMVHGISGLVIFALPIYLCTKGVTPPGFIWVTVGGALIGVGGLLLSFLRTGCQILRQEVMLNLLPSLLFLTTLSFVIGFNVIK